MNNLHTRLKELRELEGLNKKELVKKLNLQYTTYCGYENGTREPDNLTLVRIADYYNVTTDYLLGKTDRKEIKVVKYNIDGYEAVVHIAKDKNITPEKLIQLINILSDK